MAMVHLHKKIKVEAGLVTEEVDLKVASNQINYDVQGVLHITAKEEKQKQLVHMSTNSTHLIKHAPPDAGSRQSSRISITFTTLMIGDGDLVRQPRFREPTDRSMNRRETFSRASYLLYFNSKIITPINCNTTNVVLDFLGEYLRMAMMQCMQVHTKT